MKKMKWLKRSLMAGCLSLVLVVSSFSSICYGAGTNAKETEASDIEIQNVEDFLAFVENCKYDSWSVGKTVSLATDLDLIGVEFDGAAYFNGTFEGNNHTLSNVELDGKSSDYGFFRYIGELGIVKDLHISGEIKPSGSQENIGGIAGVNYGTITDCSFDGEVYGIDSVGAIAGANKETGKIVSCDSNALVLATNRTGGVVGWNDGLISGCVSESHVNIEELEPTLDLAGMDVSSLNVARNVVNRNDMGGIAGYSTGLITDCTNEGIIGYKHTGYNAGGIVGNQSGIVINCVNQGEVYGRKDVGGIAGQAQPYVESEYLEDKVNKTKNDINRLNNTLNNITSTMSETSSEVRDFAENNSTQDENSAENTPESVEELTDTISGQLSAGASNKEIEDLANTVDEGVQSIAENMESAVNQLNNIANSVSNDIAAITSDEKIVTDISSVKTAENMDGVISDCKNYGSIHGDLNVGGIAGTMNVEYAGDPEFDFDFTDSLNITLRSTVNDVMIHCMNYGEVTAKKNCAGGIVGLQELGYVYDCEGYGDISSDSGNYLGGIAGQSMAAIEKSYSLCNIIGIDYVGGICGSGSTVKKASAYAISKVTESESEVLPVI